MPSDTTKVKIVIGRERRRRYSAEQKLKLVEETMQPGMTVSAVARLHGVSPGGVVRETFAIDTHDREVMAWQATTTGISGEMIRNLMLACVEQRFGTCRAPHPLQWLAVNGRPI